MKNSEQNSPLSPTTSLPEVNLEIPPSFHLEWSLKKDPELPHYFHLAESFLTSGKPKVQDPLQGYQAVDIEATFGLKSPIEVEIGCGKGSFLVGVGENFPNLGIIGIDQVPAIAGYAAKRISKRPQFKNIRVLEGEAHVFIEKFLPPTSVSAFHMYFPDPWPKKRHLKRRSLTLPFLKSIQKAATQEANFYWATDFADYHEQAKETFSMAQFQLIEDHALPTYGVETNFEKKYKREGRAIYRSVYRINQR